MVHGAADILMCNHDPRRFGSYATNGWQLTKTQEDFSLRDDAPFWHFNRLAESPSKPFQSFDLLNSKGSCMMKSMGSSVIFGLRGEAWCRQMPTPFGTKLYAKP